VILSVENHADRRPPDVNVSASPGAPGHSPGAARLPEPVVRWLRIARPEREVPPKAIYLAGPARFKRGRLPYLPLDIRIWTRLGSARVSELEVRIAGLTLMRGLDAFVDGRGFTRVGSDLSAGPSVDQGAFHVLFLESLLVPSAWPATLRWQAVSTDSVRVTTPFAGGQEEALLNFDPVTGLPSTYETHRFKTDGRKVPWTAFLGGWRDFGNLLYPSWIEAQWADERQPWLKMRIREARRDPPMDEPLSRARAVLAGIPA
jgi:hypothetical protein